MMVHVVLEGVMECKLASGVLRDKNVLSNLKSKFYKVVVRLAILYVVKHWPVKELTCSKDRSS